MTSLEQILGLAAVELGGLPITGEPVIVLLLFVWAAASACRTRATFWREGEQRAESILTLLHGFVPNS